MATAEVVRNLGVTIEEVRCLTRNGELRALMLGGSRSGQTRIPPEDLRAYQRRLHD
ncbi:MAG: helix-turn-helix domain-containing protein [Methanoculleus sp.]|nr:helix-turn-helix domain-containing protein [Methanoculleus sp.]